MRENYVRMTVDKYLRGKTMGYLFLTIALLCGSIKGFCGKKISGKVNTLKGVFYINTLRMLLCIAIGFFIVLLGGIGGFKVDLYTLFITAMSGITTALFVATWIISVRKGAYLMIDIFLMLGSVLTIILCNLFFKEAITINQCIGFLLLLASTAIMCSYSSSIKGSFSLSSFLILAFCGLSNGLTDFSQKCYVKTVEGGSIAVFNFYTYIFAALALLIFFMISHKFEKEENDGKSFKVFLVVCIMSICLFSNSYFKTMAAKFLNSAMLYPVSNSAAIVLSAIMASVFFGEKMTKKSVLGIILTFMAIIIMSL